MGEHQKKLWRSFGWPFWLRQTTPERTANQGMRQRRFRRPLPHGEQRNDLQVPEASRGEAGRAAAGAHREARDGGHQDTLSYPSLNLMTSELWLAALAPSNHPGKDSRPRCASAPAPAAFTAQRTAKRPASSGGRAAAGTRREARDGGHQDTLSYPSLSGQKNRPVTLDKAGGLDIMKTEGRCCMTVSP